MLRSAVVESFRRLGATINITRILRHRARTFPTYLTGLQRMGTHTLGLTATDEQLRAVAGLLGGRLCEMDTGEGKTLVGMFAAVEFAKRGRRVSLITANDYLAERDARWAVPLAEAAGLRIAAITARSSPEQRRSAYTAEIVVTTVQEIGFDLLRDRTVRTLNERVLPGRDLALVDEADAVLLDEAELPLVLARDSAISGSDAAAALAADRTVATLDPARDITPGDAHALVVLTSSGIAAVEAELGVANLFEHESLLACVNLALQARFVLRLGRDYVIRDGAVAIISAERGRIVPRERFADGLQRALEIREGLAPSPAGVVLDTITVGEILAGFGTVTGMSATLWPARAELSERFGLRVLRVPRHHRRGRVDLPDRIFLTGVERDEALRARIHALNAAGTPTLVVTQSVADSEELVGLLRADGLHPRLLNARNNEAEAGLIASAGEYAAITVSTQISGRGTDIRLGPGAREAGGLAVLLRSRFPSRRLDRQARGRAGRGADPGQSQAFISLDDSLVRANLPVAQDQRRIRLGDHLPARDRQDYVDTAARVAEGAATDRRFATARFQRVPSLQRAAVLRLREPLLTGGPSVLVGEAGDALARELARDLLDRRWSEHLGALEEVRDGIHLRALAGEDPADAFDRIAFEMLGDVAAEIATEVAQRLASGLSETERSGLHDPAATWTYTRAWNPFAGGGFDRLISGMIAAHVRRG